METPWGNLSVSDAHIHFFSHRFFSILANQKGGLTAEELGPLLEWDIPAPDPAALAAQWVRELDRHGVDKAVLIASLPGDEDSVVAAVRCHGNRFHGYFFLNPLENGAPTVRRVIGAGLHGVCLVPAMHRYSLHDPALQDVFQTIAEHPGTIVFVHCGVLTVGVRQKLGLPSHFDLRFSNPLDLHAIALRYPNLRFVVPHFGAGFFREALMLCDLCPNVYLDTSSSNRWMRYEPQDISLAQVFKRALDVAGPDRLLFGTDSSFFPRGWNYPIFQAQVEALREIGVSSTDAAKIFGGNLNRLLASR
jgi:Predicted metal-dependent hydrolase of the TIM-barrel fold